MESGKNICSVVCKAEKAHSHLHLSEVDMAEAAKWTIKNLCVFCGSSSPKEQKYADGALELTQEMLKRGIGLVYGGGTHGMMGLIGKSVHEGMDCR